MKPLLKLLGLSFLFIVVLAGCSMGAMDHFNMGNNQPQEQKPADVVETDGKKIINIEAKETHWIFNDEIMDMAWTYNGTLPGQEIRVNEGDHVRIVLKNSLSEPTALHLHGLPVPNEMDGVPGVTQNAVLPGEEFVYEFVADTPGTYWYHSHQKGAEQVGKGLYGAFIVEPKDQKDVTLDQMIIIDEWSSMGRDMSGMDHGASSNQDDTVPHGEQMNEMYDTMIINGKAAPVIDTVNVSEGDTIKLRFLNAGLFTQVISIPGHSFKVTHYDGQEVNEPELLSDVSLRIAPAERYDVEIIMNQPGAWGFQVFAEENKEKLNALIPFVYNDYESTNLQTVDSVKSYFDMTTYGQSKDIQIGELTKEYQMVLGTNDGGESFTINNKQMPEHEVYEVDEGDVVKVTISNETDVDHPMHLHGQFFYVISRNGESVQGSPIVKDTLNVRPNETYEIVFVADNPGHWMFHCHELHHAAGGMVSEVKYNGYVSAFTPDPNIDNQPE